MGSFILMIKASKTIGYCSSLSIIGVSSRDCNLGSLFRLSSSFSTLFVVKVFMLSNLASKSNWHGFDRVLRGVALFKINWLLVIKA